MFCTLLSPSSLLQESQVFRNLGTAALRGEGLAPSDFKAKQRASTVLPRCVLLRLPPPFHASVSGLCHIPSFSAFVLARISPINSLPLHLHPQSCFVSLHLCLAAPPRTRSLRTVSGSQLPGKPLGPTHACIRSKDRPLVCISACTHTFIRSRQLELDFWTHRAIKWRKAPPALSLG